VLPGKDSGGQSSLVEIDGLHEVLRWPTLLCWIVAVFTAYIPLVGTAAGIWGARAAWAWSWPASLGLFLGIPALMLAAVGIVAAVAIIAERRRM
jgi:hypothetical protein